MSGAECMKTLVGRRGVLGAAVLSIGLAGAAAAPAMVQVVRADPVDLAVIDRATGQALPVWRRDGRLFVAGEPGARYSLRITSHMPGRVLVVMSVDGINIISGQTANYRQGGYVLEPFQSYEVAGWRKSDTEIADFSFAPLPQSYAARTGRPADVGVIGMAVFRERPLLEPLEASPRALPAPAPSRPFAAPLVVPAPPPGGSSARDVVVTGSRLARRDFGPEETGGKLGTAHGAREWSVVQEVRFVRATPDPEFVEEIEYDTYANLVARGVIGHGGDEGRQPRAFPSQPQGGGFVPDPPDEK